MNKAPGSFVEKLNSKQVLEIEKIDKNAKVNEEEVDYTVSGHAIYLKNLTAEQLISIEKLYNVAKISNQDPDSILRNAGLSEETIIFVSKLYENHIEPLRKQGIDPKIYCINKKTRMIEEKAPTKMKIFRWHNEGMRRLGIVIGIIFALIWVIFAAILTDEFKEVHDLGWFIFFSGIPFFFAIGRLLLWAIDWVISGFIDNFNDSTKNKY